MSEAIENRRFATGIQDRACVSEALQEQIFAGRLKKSETEALYRRCVSYQSEAPEPWSHDLYRPYAQYFGFLSSLKAKSILGELWNYGFLKPFEKTGFDLIDFGAGTLGATLGAVEFARESGLKMGTLTAIDQNIAPMKWGLEFFSDFFESDPELKTQLSSPREDRPQILIASDVLNECEGFQSRHFDSPALLPFFNWIKNMNDQSMVIWVEPANKKTNQNFLAARNHIKKFANILLPCTHSLDCPALEQYEWCHEDRDYLAPSQYWNLVREMGFHRDVLSFSFLALSKRTPIFSPQQGRIVSRDLRNKGRCDKWLCSNGKRWKAGLLKRHENDQNRSFFGGRRGDIVDCVSTGIKTPD